MRHKRSAELLFIGAGLAALLGFSSGCATSNYNTYAQTESKQEVWVPPKVVQEWNANDVWTYRQEAEVRDGYVAFTAYVGQGNDRQKELFVGKYNDGQATDIKRLTYTPQDEESVSWDETQRIWFFRRKGNASLSQGVYHINREGNDEH